MHIAMKKVSDAKSCQGFLHGLHDRVRISGYVTEKVEEVLNELKNQCATYAEEKISFNNQLMVLAQDKQNPLQSFYVIASILKGFDISTSELESIGKNVHTTLKEQYEQELLLDEYNLDMRLAGWSILEEVVFTCSSDLRESIAFLATRVEKLPQEDELLRTNVIKLSLRLNQ